MAASSCSSAPRQRHFSPPYRTSYPAHDFCATLTLAHHVAGAVANLPARQVARRLERVRPLAKAALQMRVKAILFVAAMQRVLDQLVAVLEQVGTELSARAREVVQCVQVQLAGKLSDNTVRSSWSACRRGAELVLAVGAGSRITAEGCRERVDVRVRPLVCCFRMLGTSGSEQAVQQRLHIRDAGC